MAWNRMRDAFVVAGAFCSCVIVSGRLAAEEDREATAKSLCARFESYQLPKDLAPTAADRERFGSESMCSDYVFAIVGDERDYDKARRCCLVRGDCNRELGMIFANGWGVSRNFDAATAFLCRAGEEMAPLEQWSMLEQVQKMRTAASPKDLQYCDYATSGAGSTFCEQVDDARRAEEIGRRIEGLRPMMNAEAQRELASLEETASAFAEAEGGWRADENRGGTAYPAIVLAEQGKAEIAHLRLLEQYTRRRAPAVSPEALAGVDRALNTAYKAAMAAIEPCPTCAEGDPGGRDALREAQRAWIKYRDAWSRYYCARWKGKAEVDVLDREIRGALTGARTVRLGSANGANK